MYLSEAWHPLVGFLYGWALLFMIETGAMAAVAITFAQYASRMTGGSGADPQLIAVAAIVCWFSPAWSIPLCVTPTLCSG